MDRSAKDNTIEVVDEVHRAEEEIDRFLRTNSEQAEKLLAEARIEADAIRRQGERDIQLETQRLRDRLLNEAEEQAGQIETKGETAASAEAERLESLREEVIAHILRLVRAES